MIFLRTEYRIESQRRNNWTAPWLVVPTTESESRDLDLVMTKAELLAKKDGQLLFRIIGFVWWSRYPKLVWASL